MSLLKRILKFLVQDKWAVCVTAFLAAAAFIVLFVPPNVGMADNGDFNRVLGSFAIDSQTDDWYVRYFNFAHLQFDIHNPSAFFRPLILVTSHLFVIAIAKFLNMLFFSTTVFDIRFLSGLYYMVFLTSAFFIIAGFRKKTIFAKSKIACAVLALFFIFMAGDAQNLAYFNSFYSEPFSFVCFFASLAFAVWAVNRPNKNQVFTFVGMMFFATAFFTSKPQYTVLAVPFVIAVVLYCKLDRKKIKTSVLAACVVPLVLSAIIFSWVPASISSATLFNSVFNGILRDAENVYDRLEILGLDERFSRFAYQQIYFVWFEEGFDDYLREFEAQISRGTVLRYYMRHPNEFIGRMQNTARVMFDSTGTEALGNFDISQNPEPGAQNSFFTLYSQLKELIPHTLWFIILFYVVYGVLLVFVYRKLPEVRGIIWILGTVMVMGVSQFPMPVLANGETDVGKQLFFFNLTFDMSLAALVGVSASVLLQKAVRMIQSP